MSLAWYLILAGILFVIGAAAALVRRSAVIVFMGIEMILNAANLILVAFARINSDVDDKIMAFFVVVVAAAEVVVGLSIIVSIYHSRSTTSMDDPNLLENWRRM